MASNHPFTMRMATHIEMAKSQNAASPEVATTGALGESGADTASGCIRGVLVSLHERLCYNTRSARRDETLGKEDLAVRIHSFGSPEVATYEEAPKPEPKENEELFKVTSTSPWTRSAATSATLPLMPICQPGARWRSSC